jgi:hypothetical protein
MAAMCLPHSVAGRNPSHHSSGSNRSNNSGPPALLAPKIARFCEESPRIMGEIFCAPSSRCVPLGRCAAGRVSQHAGERCEPNRAAQVKPAPRRLRRSFLVRRDERRASREPPSGGRHYPLARLARVTFLHESIYAFFLFRSSARCLVFRSFLA